MRKHLRVACFQSALLVCCLPFVAVATAQQGEGKTKNVHFRNCTEKDDPARAVCRGPWSSQAVSLFNTWTAFDIEPDRSLRFRSPDGEKVIAVDGFHARIRINGKAYWTPFGMMHDAEVGWAPDSTRLFVTWTEAGGLGDWHVQVYDVTENGLREIKGVTRNVSKDFMTRQHKAPMPKGLKRDHWEQSDYCDEGVVGSQWLNGSSEILVAALAGPDSGCRFMDDFVVYRIEVATGKTLQSYTATEAHLIFGDADLPELGDANDDI